MICSPPFPISSTMLTSLANPAPSLTSLALAKSSSFSPRFGIRRSSSRFSSPVCETMPSEGRVELSTMEQSIEGSEADRLVDQMLSYRQKIDGSDYISNPSMEATARQLVRDILDMREGNRALGTFAISVKYNDPLRSFTGREKYKRATWIRDSLDNPSVAVREVGMQSQMNKLNIKWVLNGRPKYASFGDFSLVINSTFTLNRISGVVLEHTEEWDISASPLPAQLYFWVTRLTYSFKENGNDVLGMIIKQIDNKLLEITRNEESETIYRDPKDPTKFYQMESNPERDFYQIAFFVAFIYLVVQFLKEIS